MPINGFELPGVTFRQTYAETAAGTIKTLSVVCVGPQFNLHRADTPAEAAYILTSSDYDPSSGLVVASLPGRASGSVVDSDESAQHLVVKNGVFKYLTETDDTQYAVSGSAITFDYPVKDGGGFVAADGFGTRGARVGDPIIISDGVDTVITSILRIDHVDGVGLCKITVPSAALGGAGAEVGGPVTSIGFCVLMDASFDAGAATFSIDESAGSLTIEGGLQAGIAELSGVVGDLQGGDFYIEYRERVSSYVNKLGTVESLTDIVSALGTPCRDNPLALACYFALQAGMGSTVFFTAVPADTAEAYTLALDFLERYTMLYSVVPCTEDVDIIRACLASCEQASNDERSKVRRSLWYGVTHDAEPVLWSGTATFASGASKTATLSGNAFLDYPLQAGDVLRLRLSPFTEFEITATDDVSVATLDAEAVIPNPAVDLQVQLVRTAPVNADLIANIIAKRTARTQSERAVCVWADGALYNGEEIDNYALAAAAAGMRAYEAPHRPLSNLGYSFFSLSEPFGFSLSQLKQIGAEGIWMIANNDAGLPINMRQITTAVANMLSKDEESIIANADTIAIDMVRVGESLVGCSNISPDLLYSLESALRARLDRYLINTSGSDYVGPQLLDYDLVSMWQDTVNLDHVYANFDITPPRPFNRFHMTMRIM